MKISYSWLKEYIDIDIDYNELSIILTDIIIGYENISSILSTLMINLGVDYRLEELKNKKFIDGRCASVVVKNKIIGEIGEIHPEVIENFGLETPIIALELNLEEL